MLSGQEQSSHYWLQQTQLAPAGRAKQSCFSCPRLPRTSDVIAENAGSLSSLLRSRGVADGGEGGGVLTPHFFKLGVDLRTFYDVGIFFFAVNCINIKQTGGGTGLVIGRGRLGQG